MEHFVQTAKQHPYIIGGGVLVGALLILFMFKKPAATGGTYAAADQTDTTNAQINAQLVMAQDALSAQGNQAQFALETTQNNNATAVQLAQGANATSLAGAQINATTALAQSGIAQQTSLLTLASQSALQSQQTGMEYNLENTALQLQHSDNVNNVAASISSRFDPTYATGAFQNIISSETGAPESLIPTPWGGGWVAGTEPGSAAFQQAIGQTQGSVAPAGTTSPVTSSYLDNVSGILAAITHQVALGSPTAPATST